MCNCKSPYNKMYVAYQKAASEACKAYPAGAKGIQSVLAMVGLGRTNSQGRINHIGRLGKVPRA